MAKRTKRTTETKPRRSRSTEDSGIAGMKIPAKYQAAVDRASRSAIGARLWKPEDEGDAVAGKILSATWRESGNGPYCSMILDSGTESIMVRPGAVLSRQLAESGTKIGAEVVFVYRGSQSFGRGRPARLIAMEQVKAGEGETIMDQERLDEMEAARDKRNGRRKTTKATSKKGKRGKRA